MKRRTVLMILVIALVILFTGGFMTVRSNAENSASDQQRYYRSVEIEAGETLWSISSEYAADLGMTTKEYLSELMRLNGMDSDRIIAGTKLIVICPAQE